MDKAEIRKSMMEQRSKLSDEKRIFFDASIRQRFLLTDEYRLCRCLFCYISFGSELDTKKIILQALKDDKKVYVPRVEEDHRMEFYHIEDMKQLVPSSFGVLEPLSEVSKRYSKDIISDTPCTRLMLLPGLAFDSEGNRIGYGAGYYDRYLIQYPEQYFYKIAACYDFQFVEQLPAFEYDIKADAVITPTKKIICS